MNVSGFLPTVRLRKGALEIIDQTKLPSAFEVRRLVNEVEICEAITSLRVRGAPALGVTGAYGLLIAVEAMWNTGSHFMDTRGEDVVEAVPKGLSSFPSDVTSADVVARLDQVGEVLADTRPTAVNLRWAIDRMRSVYRGMDAGPKEMIEALLNEAVRIHNEDLDMCRRLGKHGAQLIGQDDGVLTHCNTGGLATGGVGTALGVVFAAVHEGKNVHVFADETRPLLQGARLTAWECERARVPVTILVDGAAATLMSRGEVNAVIVGADRIAANGDTANKVGTLGLAVLAGRYGVPFYVAAPTSTIDSGIASGAEIPIEQRPPEEVKSFGRVVTAPERVDAFNPAFDVTPADLITAIITEDGVFRPPFRFE